MLLAHKATIQASGDALLGLSAPAGIGLLAGQSLHARASESLSLVSGGEVQLSSGEHTRLLANQALGWSSGLVEGAVAADAPGLQLASAKGEVKIQAQNASIALRSREQLKVVSVNAEAELAAGKRLHLATAGGAAITLEGGHIHITCPGEIKVHASQKEFLGGTHLSREMNSWPEAKFRDAYIVRNKVTGKPLANIRVELRRLDGAVLHLLTDKEGRLPEQASEWMENVSLRVLGKVKK